MQESPSSCRNEEVVFGGSAPLNPLIAMFRSLLTTGAFLLSAAATAAVIPQAAEAYPRCSSFSYGIGQCVNQGWNNGGYQPQTIRMGDSRGLLLEQPRFQPSFGSSYGSGHGNGRYSSWYGW